MTDLTLPFTQNILPLSLQPLSVYVCQRARGFMCAKIKSTKALERHSLVKYLCVFNTGSERRVTTCHYHPWPLNVHSHLKSSHWPFSHSVHFHAGYFYFLVKILLIVVLVLVIENRLQKSLIIHPGRRQISWHLTTQNTLTLVAQFFWDWLARLVVYISQTCRKASDDLRTTSQETEGAGGVTGAWVVLH